MKPLNWCHENMTLFWKSCIGGNAPILALAISFANVEAGLRIVSLLIGCLVGLLSIWSIWKHRNDKK